MRQLQGISYMTTRNLSKTAASTAAKYVRKSEDTSTDTRPRQNAQAIINQVEGVKRKVASSRLSDTEKVRLVHAISDLLSTAQMLNSTGRNK